MFTLLKDSVDDSKTEVNPAHLVAFALTTAVIFWVSFIVLKTRTLPDLTGPAYLLGGSGALNVAHKFEDIVASFRKSSNSSALSSIVPPPMIAPPPAQ